MSAVLIQRIVRVPLANVPVMVAINRTPKAFLKAKRNVTAPARVKSVTALPASAHVNLARRLRRRRKLYLGLKRRYAIVVAMPESVLAHLADAAVTPVPKRIKTFPRLGARAILKRHSANRLDFY